MFRRRLACWAVVAVSSAVLWIGCSAASAQTTARVRVVRDQAIIWRPGFVTQIALVTRGDEFDVLSRQGDWFEVVVPPTSSTARTVGFIAAAQVQVISGTPPAVPAPSSPASNISSAAATPAAGPVPRKSRKPPGWPDRGFVTVGGGGRVTSTSTTTLWTVPTYQESSAFNVTYPARMAPVVNAGVAVRVVSNLAAFVTVTRYANHEPATVALSVPHPFFFNQPRTASGQTSDLSRTELAGDVDALWMISASGRIRIALFGGATIFYVTQQIVSSVTYADAYPFDSISFLAATTEEPSTSAVGANAGADVIVRLSREVALAGGVRYSHGKTTLARADGVATSLNLGGADVLITLRLRF